MAYPDNKNASIGTSRKSGSISPCHATAPWIGPVSASGEGERLDSEANGGGQAGAQRRFAETLPGQVGLGTAVADAGRKRGAQFRRA